MSELLKWGVAEFYVCAGARNLPLVEALAHVQSSQRMVFNHFEERAAGFYALGRIKSLQRPVAVVTTSGTAVGELLPSVMESYYSGLPLVVISADRPSSYRGTGAPQSAEQKNIFGVYVSHCFDLENTHVTLNNVPHNKPLHINICFNTPLLSGNLDPIPLSDINLYPQPLSTPECLHSKNTQALLKFLGNKKNIVVIVSQIKHGNKERLIEFLIALNAPVYIESISHLREDPRISHLQIKCPDKLWNHLKKLNTELEGVLKIGGTPTHRMWRDLDETYSNIPVLSVSENEFSGLPHAENLRVHFSTFFNQDWLSYSLKKVAWTSFLQEDKLCYERFLTLLRTYPLAEQSFIHALSQHIPKNSHVYLGNSLPIRYWDLAASYDEKLFTIDASRGLNGIDGQISCFLGFANNKTENWGIFGDLTTLYDLSAPWVLQYRPQLNAKLCTINNGGGQIFNKILPTHLAQLTLNPHKIQFENWAKLWSIDYYKITHPNHLNDCTSLQSIVEIFPCPEQTDSFSKKFTKV